jgi:hypothetical protein
LEFDFTRGYLNLEELTGTLDVYYKPGEFQADLLAYITPSVKHTLLGRLVEDVAANFGRSRGQPPYVGVVTILLTLSALTWKKRFREIWPWFGIGLFFFLLSLGSVLRINGQHYEQVPLLLPYLDWFAPLKGVRTNFYHVGLLLPLAVCSAYGLLRWLVALKNKPVLRNVLVVALSVLLLFEYWNGPYPLTEQAINPIYADLAGHADDQAIIELPMGRHRSKLYVYLQTVHGLPLAEGASARTPDDAYTYIEQNALLSLWRSTTALNCDQISPSAVDEALDQLIDDDFRYVVIHSTVSDAAFTSYFVDEPIYEDDDLTVFDLFEMRGNPPCSDNDSIPG